MIDLGSRGRPFFVAIVLPCVLAMAGCQGVSTAKSSTASNNPSGTGAASQLSALASSINFGSVQLGSNQSQSAIVTNSGGSTITISQATVSGAGFSLKAPTLPLSLTAGRSNVFTITFAAQAAGAASGNLSITSNASNPTLSVALSATGVAAGSLVANPGSLNFGQVQVGATPSATATLTNSSGMTVAVSQANVTGSAFLLTGLAVPLTLTAGQSINFTVTFAPKSTGAATGDLTILSTATNSTLDVPLSGTSVTPGLLGANPGSVSFGTVAVGNNQTQSVTLGNSGGSSVAISKASITGPGFSLSGLTTPLTLNAGQNKTFNIIFSPASAGSASGSVSITSNASNPSLSISLSGTGGSTVAGQLSVSPSSINFGTVTVGTSQSQAAKLNASTGAVTVSSLGGLSGSEFSVSGIILPVTISAGSSASFTVTFAPQASGGASASASFASNASNSPTVQALSGTGAVPIQHTVNLSWTASTSTVVGYNVYRGTQSGGPYSKVNPVLQASTNYSDATVQSGQTYYYVTTAVDSSSVESQNSNEVQAVIPFP